ncbi:putative membrane protein [Terracoccus luteus]|uniref:Putative membrane protein n=1 Tax=Terracoccus luteus TaxID=53356 RepID=A0A495XY65_9MICO|nr:anthrone oxygenase family protein [Terracoccus luteus]RKT79540.1 putative membrane protein [Terracoccus luteus]
MSGLLQVIALVTAVASGLTGGALFAFSSVVMPALARVPPATALPTMQAVNRVAPRSALMVPLVGSPVGCVVVGVWAAVAADGPTRLLLVAGAVFGVAAFVVTAAYHVPRNDALARVPPDSAGATGATGSTGEAGATGATGAWESYRPGWTAMNHVRVALALLSAVLLVAGAVRGA